MSCPLCDTGFKSEAKYPVRVTVDGQAMIMNLSQSQVDAMKEQAKQGKKSLSVFWNVIIFVILLDFASQGFNFCAAKAGAGNWWYLVCFVPVCLLFLWKWCRFFKRCRDAA